MFLYANVYTTFRSGGGGLIHKSASIGSRGRPSVEAKFLKYIGRLFLIGWGGGGEYMCPMYG